MSPTVISFRLAVGSAAGSAPERTRAKFFFAISRACSGVREPWRPSTMRLTGNPLPRPLGYDCRGESGSFTLRRRTAGNLAVELTLDVGTCGNAIAAFMRVVGLADGHGFKATLSLPVF